MISFETLQYEIAQNIGFDVALVNAEDKEAHFDTPDFLFSFAGIIIGSWCKGFLESAAKDLGSKAWKGLKEKIVHWTGKGPRQQIDPEDQELGQQIVTVVKEAEASIQDEQRHGELRQAAREEAIKMLTAYNFPRQRADQLVRQIESKMHQ